MKYLNKIFVLAITASLVLSCTIHDPIGDVTSTGSFVPTVYWDVPEESVPAGGSVKFEAQYYSTLKKSQIDRAEVWYSLDQYTTRSAECPLFGLDLIFKQSEIDTVLNARPSLLIETYAHDEASWDVKKSAFQLNSTFPVSYNLGKMTWGNERQFDEESYEKYFRAGYLEEFRDSLYAKMKAANFKLLLTVISPRMEEAEFDALTDQEWNEQDQKWVMIIKPENVERVKDLMWEIPVDSLIFNSVDNRFLISYEKNYKINANLKVVDKDNKVGVSETKTMSIN